MFSGLGKCLIGSGLVGFMFRQMRFCSASVSLLWDGLNTGQVNFLHQDSCFSMGWIISGLIKISSKLILIRIRIKSKLQ